MPPRKAQAASRAGEGRSIAPSPPPVPSPVRRSRSRTGDVTEVPEDQLQRPSVSSSPDDFQELSPHDAPVATGERFPRSATSSGLSRAQGTSSSNTRRPTGRRTASATYAPGPRGPHSQHPDGEYHSHSTSRASSIRDIRVPRSRGSTARPDSPRPSPNERGPVIWDPTTGRLRPPQAQDPPLSSPAVFPLSPNHELTGEERQANDRRLFNIQDPNLKSEFEDNSSSGENDVGETEATAAIGGDGSSSSKRKKEKKDRAKGRDAIPRRGNEQVSQSTKRRHSQYETKQELQRCGSFQPRPRRNSFRGSSLDRRDREVIRVQRDIRAALGATEESVTMTPSPETRPTADTQAASRASPPQDMLLITMHGDSVPPRGRRASGIGAVARAAMGPRRQLEGFKARADQQDQVMATRRQRERRRFEATEQRREQERIGLQRSQTAPANVVPPASSSPRRYEDAPLPALPPATAPANRPLPSDPMNDDRLKHHYSAQSRGLRAAGMEQSHLTRLRTVDGARLVDASSRSATALEHGSGSSNTPLIPQQSQEHHDHQRDTDVMGTNI
ncbi:Hypothetical protein D9617_4g003600 [Elsinoe fawcettii]|nr:Hypothetical protein D9617_4g003600 [Elsinoe fawcettii]